MIPMAISRNGCCRCDYRDTITRFAARNFYTNVTTLNHRSVEMNRWSDTKNIHRTAADSAAEKSVHNLASEQDYIDG